MHGKNLGSIYGIMDDGLTVKDGRLINNRPCSKSGIEKGAELRNSSRRAAKLQLYSEAIALGNMKSEMREGEMEIMMPFKFKR
jgi:hypothetical protein